MIDGLFDCSSCFVYVKGLQKANFFVVVCLFVCFVCQMHVSHSSILGRVWCHCNVGGLLHFDNIFQVILHCWADVMVSLKSEWSFIIIIHFFHNLNSFFCIEKKKKSSIKLHVTPDSAEN